jgi:uncharacterized cupin superfamily protein
MDEARLVETDGGLEPSGPGWFVVNVRDTAWWRSEAFGASCPFEGIGGSDERRRKTNEADARFPDVGINIHVLEPGKPNCMYHREGAQEGFLVLHGECLLLVEGEERPLRAWDFVHFPSWTDHVLVGAGDGPCAVLMVGARHAGEGVVYPVSELAQRHGAGVPEETPEPGVAYAPFPSWKRERVDNDGLPWSTSR